MVFYAILANPERQRRGVLAKEGFGGMWAVLGMGEDGAWAIATSSPQTALQGQWWSQNWCEVAEQQHEYGGVEHTIAIETPELVAFW